MACPIGGHWVCPGCVTSRNVCTTHNCPCVKTGTLWYTLNRDVLPPHRKLCQFGCSSFSKTTPSHQIWNCPRKERVPFPHSNGHVLGWTKAVAYARNRNGTVLPNGALIYPASTAWKVQIMAPAAEGAPYSFLLSTALLKGVEAIGTIEDESSGELVLCPTTSPMHIDLLFRVWSSVTFREIPRGQ